MESYEKLFICVVLLLAVPVASAIDIVPGQTIMVDCEEINVSVPVTCGMCQGDNQTCEECEDCPPCGACSVFKEMAAGEHYEKYEGVCDLDFICNLPDDRERAERSYTVETHIDKHEGDEIWVEQIIRDMFGTIIDNKKYDMEKEDIMTAAYKFNFTCPTEVIMEGVNYRTCSMYLDDYVNDTSPLFYQLSLGQTTCMQELIGCEGELRASNDLMNQQKDLRTDCESLRYATDQKLLETKHELNKTQDKITGEFVRKYYGWVPGEWAAYAVIGWLVVIAFVLYQIFGGEWG